MDHTIVIFDMHWQMLTVETHRVFFAAVMQLAERCDPYTRFL
jgi:hypothetical protein